MYNKSNNQNNNNQQFWNNKSSNNFSSDSLGQDNYNNNGNNWGGNKRWNDNNNNNYNNQGQQFKKNNYPSYNNNNPQTLGDNLEKIDWSQMQLEPFTKVFQKEALSDKPREEIDEFRESHQISITSQGKFIPDPYIEWSETHFPSYIMQVIKKAKYLAPTPIQSQAFPIILSGHDFIGIAKTGSGKTCAFLLPGIVHINAQSTVKKGEGPIVLVLAPTRELAIQIQEESDKFGQTSKLQSTCIYGGVDRGFQRRNLEKGVDMIIATPGRLIDFLESGTTNLRRVTYLVLDEADRMLDMGFEPQIRKIVSQIRPDRQTVMFSATWPKAIRNLARDFCQEDPIHIQIGKSDNSVNENIEQIVELCAQDKKCERLIEHLDEMTSDDKVLIFCQTKKGCEELYKILQSEGFRTLPIHGDKSQRERDIAMNQFKLGKVRVLVATDVASRGLDVSDITFVINYDLPKQIEDYIHRIGRTGRAGRKGKSIAFIDENEDKKIAKDVIDVMYKCNQTPDEDVVSFVTSQNRTNFSQFNNKRGGYRGGRGGRGRGGYNNNFNNNYENGNNGFRNNNNNRGGWNNNNNNQNGETWARRTTNNDNNNNQQQQPTSGYKKFGFTNNKVNKQGNNNSYNNNNNDNNNQGGWRNNNDN